MGSKELLQALKSIEFAGIVASFEQAVCIKGQVITGVELKSGLVVAGHCIDSKRKRARDFQGTRVEEWWRMARARQHADAEAIDADGDAGYESVFHLTA